MHRRNLWAKVDRQPMKHNHLSRGPKWFSKSFLCAVLHAVSQHALLIFPAE